VTWPVHAWSSNQLVSPLVAALVAEQKTADHRGELLRFIQTISADPRRGCFRNPSRSARLKDANPGCCDRGFRARVGTCCAPAIPAAIDASAGDQAVSRGSGRS
jgi:hypothetical protein